MGKILKWVKGAVEKLTGTKEAQGAITIEQKAAFLAGEVRDMSVKVFGFERLSSEELWALVDRIRGAAQRLKDVDECCGYSSSGRVKV